MMPFIKVSPEFKVFVVEDLNVVGQRTVALIHEACDMDEGDSIIHVWDEDVDLSTIQATVSRHRLSHIGTQRVKNQLQELTKHLDHASMGNVHLAWYGQLRAKEYSHNDALAETIRHFDLANEDWYKARNLA